VVTAKDPRAPFERVADELRARIASGKLPPGSRLPSGRELAEQSGVALATAQSALRRLRDEGLAVASPRGYTVTSTEPDAGDDPRREIDQLRIELAALAEQVIALRKRVDLLERDDNR
jgi:GntR family transcriptional regulator